MAGGNGRFIGQETTTADTVPPIAVAPVVAGLDLGRIGLALLPTTPVSFIGTDSLYAWGRLIVYGTVSYMAWKKYRTVAYIAMGAAGVSVATSLSSTAWKK